MIDRRLSGKHVLLLEDEEAILVPTARYFRALGCTVDTASGPDEAEAFVGERRYDLAILDLRVTRFGATEGLDVLRTIKRHAHAAGTRVILLSAYVSTDVEQEARALGADGVLRKPQPLPDLAHLASVLMEAHDE